MSERAPHSPEKQNDKSHEYAKQQHEIHKEVAERAKTAHHEHAERLDDIRKETEAKALSSKEVKHQLDKPEVEQKGHINQDLIDMTYQRTLKRTQHQLSAPNRVLSKVIHQPLVETVSEAAGKTIARPSGVLMGGITAFLGSSIFLWIARHYGYEYNFLLFALLFVGGFFIGLFVELGLFAAARRQKH